LRSNEESETRCDISNRTPDPINVALQDHDNANSRNYETPRRALKQEHPYQERPGDITVPLGSRHKERAREHGEYYGPPFKLENVEVKAAKDSKHREKETIAYAQDVSIKVITRNDGKRDSECLYEDLLCEMICERDKGIGENHEEVRSDVGADGFYLPKIIDVRWKVWKVFPTEIFYSIEYAHVVCER
jgi:hypothetical protein